MNIHKTYSRIREIFDVARAKTYHTINTVIVKTYWEIGRIIFEEEQQGKLRADYGSYLIKELSKRLCGEYDGGFSEQSLRNMRQFYSYFPIRSAVRSELSWTHYRILLHVHDSYSRNFYLIETANNQWSTRELERQINSMLYERLALSKDKKQILALSKKGQIVEKPADIIKDPYILEFLNLKMQPVYTESDLESRLINHLKQFIFELGKGFMFVERQKRITLDNEQFYIDLVFYNRILRCFVLIELKIGTLTHKDLGQLQMYVNYYDCEIRSSEENPTIGILLCSHKKDVIVKYTLPQENSTIFASQYRLVLPSKKRLEKKLRELL
ncbi:MAG: PDDEXK nuclease domain-containing protein [Candidatus Woesearchaeota archaeon]